MKRLIPLLSFLIGIYLTTFAGNCSESNSAFGFDSDPTVVTINSFPCTGGGTITMMTMDASIGVFCPSWYTFNIKVNGSTIATDQCDLIEYDLTSYLPITSVSLQSNDMDGYDDDITLSLTLYITYTPASGPSNPQTFAAATVSSAGIYLTFTPNSIGNNIVIVYDLDNTFTAPAGTPPAFGSAFAGGTLIYNNNGTSYNHTGLSPNQIHYYKAFSFDGSLYSSGLTANAITYCSDATIPFSQSFNSSIFPPSCWVTKKTAGSGNPGTWDRQTTGTYPVCSPHSGAGMTRFNSFNLSDGTAGILVTLPFTLPGPSQNYRVKFWMYRNDGYPTYADLVNIHFNNSPGLTGATLLGTINRSIFLAPVESANGWYEYLFTLPSGQAGTGRFVIFEAVSQYGHNIFLDDITIYYALSIWTGNVSADWTDPGNWTGGAIPNQNIIVKIPSDPTGSNFPSITSSTIAECSDIIIETGAIITIEDGGTLNVKNP